MAMFLSELNDAVLSFRFVTYWMSTACAKPLHDHRAGVSWFAAWAFARLRKESTGFFIGGNTLSSLSHVLQDFAQSRIGTILALLSSERRFYG